MASGSLYQAFVDIIPSTRGLRASLSKEFASAGPEAGRDAGRGVRTGILGSIGRLAAPLAAAFATLGIGRIIKDSIGNASDLAEAGTAITAVFGSADATIQKFAAGSAASLGQSTNMTLDAARVFGVFGKAAGLGGEDLAGFSTDFITLAADLASFNNTTPESAIQALGAGLRGESEPLRQYGILLDDAALKARATELGIYSGTGALTQQQKVLAAQAEIMAQTGVQQGDFAKTSGGLANQQRILSAGLTNLSTTFGAIFLPIATTVVGFLNRSVVPAFQGLAAMLSGGETPAAVAGFMGFFQPLIDFFQTSIAPAFATLAPVFATLIPQLLELWQAFSPLSLIFQALQPLLPSLLEAFAGLAATLGGALSSALSQMLPSITTLSGVLVELIGGLLTALMPVITELVGILGPVLGTIIAAVVPLFASLSGIIGDLVAAILPLITPILALIAPLVQLVGAILGPLVQLIALLLTPVIALVQVLVDLLVPVLGFVVTILSAVVGWIAEALTWFVNLVTGSGDAGAQLAAIWNQTMGMFADFFTNTFGMFVDFGANTAGMIGDFVSNTIGMFTDFWSNTVGMFSDGIGNIVSFFTSLPGQIMGAIGDMGTFLLDAGGDLIQGFIDGITGMIGGVGDAIGGVMDFVGGFFPHSPAKRGPFSGSGWKAVKDSGLAIGDQFGSGLMASQPGFNDELGSLVSVPSLTPRVDASVYGSQSRAVQTTGGGGNVYIDKIVAPDQDPRIAGRIMGREFATAIAG